MPLNLDILKKVDSYGFKEGVQINDNNYHPTRIGGLASIIELCLVTFLLYGSV